MALFATSLVDEAPLWSGDLEKIARQRHDRRIQGQVEGSRAVWLTGCRQRGSIAAIRRSGGSTVAVSEDEITEGFWRLARAGLYVEPTSALTIPALRSLRQTGAIKPEDITVLVLTGSGLKATQRTAALMGMCARPEFSEGGMRRPLPDWGETLVLVIDNTSRSVSGSGRHGPLEPGPKGARQKMCLALTVEKTSPD